MNDEEKQGDDAPHNWPSVVEQQAYWKAKWLQLPNDYSDWIKQGDEADYGGNVIEDRRQANHDRYDKEGHPFD